MTEQAQTTDERIRGLLLDGLNIMDGTFRAAQATNIASQIAAEIDRLQRELAEARAYISTIIDAPKDYPAEEGM